MKSLRIKLALWFGLSFLVVTAAFTVVTYLRLEDELRHKTWQADYPEHPDWKLHGSFSEAEVRDILRELMEASLLVSVTLVLLAGAIGYWLARKSLQPIASVNRQLQLKTSKNLDVPIELIEVDAEFRDLLRQLNDLLKRLDVSFTEMNLYAAKVAHELRTPLAILRLKVEQAGDTMPSELAEELQAELHRLTHVVDQSLLIARAEQGRLSLERTSCDLQSIVWDIVEDFQLLAREAGRNLGYMGTPNTFVMADQRHLRQIIHNLLSNALRHGQGDFTVRVRKCGTQPSLTIVNRVERCPANEEYTLGLGLRVVTVLLRMDPDIHFQCRRARVYYAVRLTFLPADIPLGSGSKKTPHSKSLAKAVKAVPDEREDFFI